MIPGRKLDALIAEKVMGMVVNQAREDMMPKFLKGPGTFSPAPIPRYSTDIAATWEVAEKIAQKWDHGRSGRVFRIQWDTESKDWYVVFGIDVLGEVERSATGRSAAHAICLAALQIADVL